MDINSVKIINDQDIERLRAAAWRVRENSYVIGPTKVGCAVLGTDGSVYVGCNVEHRFRSHDVHAEVNAITTMVSAGCRSLTAVFIAAERDRFTPCGACMDWIMQFADGGDCAVLAQRTPQADIQSYTANQLMPLYPK
jgi:cytidine deaminase